MMQLTLFIFMSCCKLLRDAVAKSLISN